LTNLLSAAELESMRSDLEGMTLPDVGVILGGTAISDGMGGESTVWGTATANIPCRIDVERGVEPVTGGQLHPFAGFTLTVPHDTVLTTDNRFMCNGVTYNITSITSGSWMIDKRAELEEI
jgi:hypothetical protein